MAERTLNILIGGEAGQGLVTVGQLLAKSLVRAGYHIIVTQSYESRIRGGHNSFSVRVSDGPLVAPCEPIDVLVALTSETADIHRADLAPDALVVADKKFDLQDRTCLHVPFAELSESRYSNVVALGVIGSLLGLEEDLIAETVGKLFGKKSDETAGKNRAALRRAFEWTEKQDSAQEPLPAGDGRSARMMMNGNEAIALGAMSAGLKFCSFYPMTPSTSIPLTLAKNARRMGMVIEQAEDEIAAINMALGASYAGAPSMVATSGGGFALMVEGVSLAAMTETPVLIVVAQRPAPATGLPTRTEQADLEFVLHAGHGEFPRAVFAPGSVEECFHLTRKALDLTWRFQTPVFLLTDQYLADSYRAVEPFDAGSLPAIDLSAGAPVRGTYERHAITESGVSPRLFPGMGEHLVVTDSDEHTPDGHITEDLIVRTHMVEKRLRKSEGMRKEVIPPTYDGDKKPDLLLITWGSTRGSALEAAARIREGGRSAAVLHFSQVWPLVPEQFTGSLESAREVVSVEGNALGQFARLIRRETGFRIGKHVGRYDGLPITPEFILRRLANGPL